MIPTLSSDTLTRVATFLTLPDIARMMCQSTEIRKTLKPVFKIRSDNLILAMPCYTEQLTDQLLLLFNPARKISAVFTRIGDGGIVEGYTRFTKNSVLLTVITDDMIFLIKPGSTFLDITVEAGKSVWVTVRVIPESSTTGVVTTPTGEKHGYNDGVVPLLKSLYPRFELVKV
jgi:hypothetical protein